MATITLDTVWINLASDPSQYRSFPLMSSLRVVKDQPGSVSNYASGRRRLVLKSGGGFTVSLTLPQLDRDQITWLEAHIGELMLVRDDRGRKIWGTYLSLPVDESQGDSGHGDASISFSEITYSEVV